MLEAAAGQRRLVVAGRFPRPTARANNVELAEEEVKSQALHQFQHHVSVVCVVSVCRSYCSKYEETARVFQIYMYNYAELSYWAL